MRRAILVVLVALGVAAALLVTGSATMTQGRAAGMAGLVPLALVVLCEVVNIAGTWVWITETRTHVKWEAGAGVGVASVITGTCAVREYGPLGLAGAFGLLFTVHLVSRLMDRPAAASPELASRSSSAPAFELDHEPVDGLRTSTTLEPLGRGHDQWGVLAGAAHDAAPAARGSDPGPVTTGDPSPAVEPVRDDYAARVADLRAYAAELGRMPGRDVVKARYSVGSSTANQLRDAASAPPALHLAAGGAR